MSRWKNQSAPKITRAVVALSREYREDMVSVPQEQTPLGTIIEQYIFNRFEILNSQTVWINVEGEQGKDINGSVYNKQFASVILQVYTELLAQGVNSIDIAIEAPYTTQIQLYNSSIAYMSGMPEYEQHKVIKSHIVSADKNTGQDFPIILIDLTHISNLGFLKSGSRTATLISRVRVG